MENDFYNNNDEERMSTDTLIQKLFSELPKERNFCAIIPICEDIDVNNMTEAQELIFEMLINIYLETVIDGERLHRMLIERSCIEKKEINKINVYDIQKENLEIPEQWFKSFGFCINVSEYSAEDYQGIKEDLHLYCKVLLKDNPRDAGYFLMRKINKLYHFVKFGNYKKATKLSDICFVINNPMPQNEKFFIISFDSIN